MPPLFGQPVPDDVPSPQALAYRRQLAQAHISQGTDTSPIAGGKWGGIAGGLSRVLKAGLGGYQMHQADVADQAARQKLADALQSGNTNAALGNPWLTPEMAKVYAEMNARKTFGERTNAAGVTEPVIGTGNPNAPPPVPMSQQGVNPSPQSGSGNGNVMSNATGYSIQNQNPQTGANVGPPVGGTFAPYPTNTPPGVTPTDAAQLNWKAQGQQATATAQAINEADLKARDAAITEGQASVPKLANLNVAKTLSDRWNDSGYVPRVAAWIGNTTGVFPGANAKNYELFDAAIKSEIPDLANDPRLTRAFKDEYRARGSQIWQDPSVREGTLQMAAMPHDMKVRALQAAFQPGSPTEIRQRITNVQPRFNSLTGGVELPGGPPAPNARTIGGGAAGQASMGGARAGSASPQAILALKANPSLRNQFDAKYGPGAAAGVLGQ